jgi:ppGpp synthetase/RelA/SpoT-type nucleotidyltranferase
MPELRPRGDHPAEPPDESPTPSADERWLSRFAAPEPADATATPEERIDSALAHHPEVASVVKRLAADDAHPLNVTQALADPTRRDATLATIAELADGRLLRDRSLAEYLADHPGTGPLFEPVAAEVNETTDGADRKTAYVDRCKTLDPARTAGANPTETQRAAVNQYAERLLDQVQPTVLAEIKEIAEGMDGARFSVRTKTGDGLLDKVQRMTAGSEGRPGRPEYQVGDVIDAVGARITVEDTEQLGTLLEAVKSRYGVGDMGRILEIENMYAQPKPGNPAYRVVPLVVGVEAGGTPYTFELQLTTKRASIAADLEHNTVYKPYVPVSGDERDRVDAMFREAAALDQEENEGRGDELAR